MTCLTMQQQLANAFCRLLEKTPYRKLSVDSICKSVPTSRRTFYNYFHDKADLAGWTVRSELERSIQPMLESNQLSQMDVLCGCFSYVRNNPSLYSALLEVDDGVFLNKCLVGAYDEFIGMAVEAYDEKSEQEPPQHTNVFRHFHAAGMAAVVVHWIREGMTLSEETIATELGLLVEQPLYYLPDGNSQPA